MSELHEDLRNFHLQEQRKSERRAIIRRLLVYLFLGGGLFWRSAGIGKP